MIEKELIRKAKKGEVGAFAQLVEIYEKEIITYCYYIIKDKEEAKDLAQEAFLKAFINLKSLRNEEDFKYWLLRIAKNGCFKKLSRMKIEKKLISKEEEKSLSIVDELIKDDRRKKIMNALNKLDKKDKEIIILRDIQDYSYDEISKILKISMNLVKVRLYRARKNLKKIIEDEYGEI
ncbi:MAG: RNA polymerase sigma factor [Caldisericia bacterium]